MCARCPSVSITYGMIFQMVTNERKGEATCKALDTEPAHTHKIPCNQPTIAALTRTASLHIYHSHQQRPARWK